VRKPTVILVHFEDMKELTSEKYCPCRQCKNSPHLTQCFLKT
jgi:hypothetical protein